MKKSRILLLLPLLTIITSCGDNTSSSSSIQTKPIDATQVSILENFKKGFKVEGTLSSVKTYFSDSEYNVPSSKAKKEDNFAFTLVYQNDDDYTGLDRRYYRVKDNAKNYLNGENVFDDNGYVGLNYLDYTNVIKNDAYSSSDSYNADAYATSGLINPFLLFKSSDFCVRNDQVILNSSKNNLMFNMILSGLSSYVNLQIPLNEGVFSSDLTNYTSTSVEHKSTAYENYTQYYLKTNYTINLNFSLIGSANSKEQIKAEPNKEENNPLGNALANMANKPIAITRHSITYSGSEKIESEEAIKTYNDGTNIYMQVYDYALTPDAPTTPSSSDLYLKANSSSALNTYVFSSSLEDGSYSFRHDSTNYSSIDGYYAYSAFQPIFNISQDIFNKNEDGSYSPTEDNLPYIGADCFVPALNSTTEIANGYITSMKIYLSEDQSYIDHIQFLFDEDIYTGYTGEIIVSYSDVGTCKIPFNINVQ